MTTLPTEDGPSTFIPFKSGVGHYDANVAKAFFKRFGKADKFAANALVFAENEQSNNQSIFKKSVLRALTTPLADSLFAKRNVHRMFLLTQGEVALSAEGKLEETARAGDVFGEMAVLSEIPDVETPARRTATARRDVRYRVLFARRRAGTKRVERAAGICADVDERHVRAIARTGDAIIEALRDQLGHSANVRFHGGAKIMQEGGPGTTMYVVFEGEVAVAIGSRIIEKVGVGGVFGEMALVDQMPRAPLHAPIVR